MRRSLSAVLALPFALLLLTGCASFAPSDSASSAAPSTIKELASALVDEGAADSATITEDSGDFGPELKVALRYDDTVEPEEVSTLVEELGPRIDAILGDERPEITLFNISLARADEATGFVTVTDEFSAEDIATGVDLAQTTACSDLITNVTAKDGTTLLVSCEVTGPEGVADAYEAATRLAPGADAVDATTWYVGSGGVEWGVEASKIVEGRGETLQSLVTEALSASVALLRVVDDGASIEVSGILDEATPAVCDTLAGILREASVSGSVGLRLPKGSGGADVCSVTV